MRHLKKHITTTKGNTTFKTCKKYHKNFKDYFDDQVKAANAVILSHLDVASDEQIENAKEIVKELHDDVTILDKNVTDYSIDELMDLIVAGHEDEEGELVCIAWAFDGTNDPETMSALYDTLHAEVVDNYGDSKSTTKDETNNGDLWRVDGGSIMIYSMITDSNKALQYSYISSKVAGTED